MQAPTLNRERQTQQRQAIDRRWLDGQADRSERRTLALLTTATSLTWIGFLVVLALTLNQLVLSHLDLAPAGDERFPVLITTLALLAILHAVLRYRSDAFAAQLSGRVAHRVRTSALETAMAPSKRFARQDSDAAIATRLGQHIDAIIPWYRESLSARTLVVIQPLLILIVVFSRDWLAGSLLLLTAPLIPLFSALVGFGTASLAEDQEQRLTRLGHHYIDRIRALTTLRLLRRVASETASITAAANDYRRTSLRILRIAFLSSAVLEFFSAIAIATLAIYIGMALLGYIHFGPADTLDFQSGLMILLLAPEFFQPLRRLAGGYHERAGALAVAPALRDLAGTSFSTSRVAPASTPRSPLTTAPGLTAQRLRIAWPGSDRTLLGPISFQVRGGEWVAITGPSGSGKTLLAGTLLGWVPPAGGRIFLGKQPLDVIADAHRHQMAWLGQHTRLLAGSLRRNLDPGERHTDDDILGALEQVGLERLPRLLPRGLDTPVGERGAGVSVGEVQRLALARALLDDVRYLVVDEPTASLDPDNEQRVLQCLSRLAGHCTVIMTTHSRQAARWADRRWNIENGSLQDAG